MIDISNRAVAGGVAAIGLFAASASWALPTCNDRIRQNCTPPSSPVSTVPTQADYDNCLKANPVTSAGFKTCIEMANAMSVDVGVTNGQTDIVKATWSSNGKVVNEKTLTYNQSESHRFPRNSATHIKVERFTAGFRWITDQDCEFSVDHDPGVRSVAVKPVSVSTNISSQPSSANSVNRCTNTVTRDGRHF